MNREQQLEQALALALKALLTAEPYVYGGAEKDEREVDRAIQTLRTFRRSES